VITVCNNANKEVCPVWPKKKTITHWDIEDPVEKFKKTKNKNKINLIAEETYNIINEKIKHWVKNEK
jgi:Protein-tyrosine-phosphatase